MEASMSKYLYVDIETLPDMSPDALETAKEGISAPSNYKDEKKIADYIEEKAQSALSKTSFDGLVGHICTIAWALDGCDPESVQIKDLDEERECLDKFFRSLPQYKSLIWVGHNVVEFDIPFLLKRAFVLNVKLPPINSFPRNPKPWDRKVFDTMNVFGRVSLDKAEKAIGFSGKNGMYGSDVYPNFCSGNFDLIESYCRDDVRRTRNIHRRLLNIGY
jgi:DNA polymerase elongation subunit (family B)